MSRRSNITFPVTAWPRAMEPIAGISLGQEHHHRWSRFIQKQPQGQRSEYLSRALIGQCDADFNSAGQCRHQKKRATEAAHKERRRQEKAGHSWPLFQFQRRKMAGLGFRQRPVRLKEIWDRTLLRGAIVQYIS